MEYNIIKVYEGTIAHEETNITFVQLCDMCQLKPEFVIELVEEGILEPKGKKRTSWRFSYDAVENAQKVKRFQRDLDINLAGAALALQLLEKIERLERIVDQNADH